MIHELSFENFLFMREAVLTFSPGLNVITGETGAGKSILLEGLKLLLGKKGRSGLVLSDSSSARVQASFSVKGQKSVLEFLEKAGLTNDDDPETLILSRSFRREGSEKIFVNGILTTTSFLKDLGRSLVEIHGQNDHQSLLQPETQLRLLDRMGGKPHQAHLETCRSLWNRKREMELALEDLQERLASGSRRLEEIRDILEELKKLNLSSPNEEEEIRTELERLVNSESIETAVRACRAALGGEDESPGAVSLLFRGREALQGAMEHDPGLKGWFEAVESVHLQAQDLLAEMNRSSREIEVDPQRIEFLQSRLSSIAKACRRHKTDLPGLLALVVALEKEVGELTAPDFTIARRQKELQEVETEFTRVVSEITRGRKKLAEKLEGLISAEMADLGFPRSNLTIRLPAGNPGPAGAESAEFIVALNPGAPGGPLRKIASGGELSRTALAIKRVLARSDDLPTLVFDEIDAGIGGTTAEAVASSLSSLASEKQVILVTHLHQIAKEGKRHFTVRKDVSGDSTSVSIKPLSGKEREAEIARMVGRPGSEGLAFARSLLKNSPGR